MARQRKSAETDQPPSYEETVNSKGGAFTEGGGGGGGEAGVQTVVQVVQIPVPELGPRPATLPCPSCQQVVTTRTSSSPGLMAWTLSAVLCLTGLWPCFFAPFCVDSLQKVKHYCPSCNVVVGKYREGL